MFYILAGVAEPKMVQLPQIGAPSYEAGVYVRHTGDHGIMYCPGRMTMIVTVSLVIQHVVKISVKTFFLLSVC